MSSSSQNAELTITSIDSPHWFHNSSVMSSEAERHLGIVVAAQAGSSAAFDELQRQYSRRLFLIILRITNNREDAEDALQDTFLRAYLALPLFRRRSSVYSWFTRIAINSALIILRKRRRHCEANSVSLFGDSDGDCARDIEDNTLNPEELCERRERCDHLVSAIQKLPPRLRAPIMFQLFGEQSIKDIAKTLNISLPAVKAKLSRARIRLANRTRMKACVRTAVHNRANPSVREVKTSTD